LILQKNITIFQNTILATSILGKDLRKQSKVLFVEYYDENE